MTYLMSFIKGVAALVVSGFILYYGLGYMDRYSSGFKGFLGALLVFPVVIYAAAYVAEKLTFGKLGGFGHAIVMILVLVCFGKIYMVTQEKKQADVFQSTARTLGFQFYEDLRLDPALAKNPALQRGFMPAVKEALSGDYRGTKTTIFNYEYEELSTDYPDHYFRTVVAFFDPRLELPEFYLRPLGLGGRIFSRKGIDFKEDPDFSNRYYLTGPDQEAIRKLFAIPQRKALIESENKWAIGSAEGYVVIYADEKMDEQIKPNAKEISAYLEKTWLLYEVLSSPLRISQ